MSLDFDLSAERIDDGTSGYVVPAGYGQGQATFGGLVVGALVRAMRERVGDDARTLRSLSAELLGAPKPGDATLRLSVLRRTGSVSTLSAQLEQNGEVLTHAVGIFAKNRAVEQSWQQPLAPQAPPWAEVEAMPVEMPFAPEFTRRFEFRPVRGWPGEGHRVETVGYVRPRLPCLNRDEAFLVAMVDVWWLAVFVGLERLQAAATLSFTVELHGSLDGLSLEAPLLHRGVSPSLRNGYATEYRELWGADGRLLTTNHQMVVVFSSK